ncbi:hypothetical protein Sru01_39420 [Sphaerisporangium rufum]|uniref:Uncharacterized protein n=1 Tax=Sphaerisporangium rufum TaxID=1381558 RepID=A0A919V634_9ACTN|nr:hypothetical protein Sru01_39420 [Sphaerisporangium rufum]
MPATAVTGAGVVRAAAAGARVASMPITAIGTRTRPGIFGSVVGWILLIRRSPFDSPNVPASPPKERSAFMGQTVETAWFAARASPDCGTERHMTAV